MKINLIGTKNLKVYGLIGLIVIALMFMILEIGTSYFNSPAVGKIVTSSVQTKDTNQTLIVQGKTFSFSYSNIFQPTAASTLSQNDVEKFSFVASETSPWNLSIVISGLPTGQITDNGSYNLRKTNSSVYAEQAVSFNSGTIYIMTANTGGYNKTAFITHGKLIALITLTSSGSVDTDKMDAALNQIFSTWKWI